MRILVAGVVAMVAVWPLAGPAREKPVSQSDTWRVLFIGNSLTAANDLPAMVEALSRVTAGPRIAASAVTAANFSLEDHWHRGTALEAIHRGGWAWVVLQQGPSALPESQVNLRAWTRRFDGEIRRAGAGTALYMVWPSRDRAFDFAGVSESYAAAARDVGGRLLAAGDAWREAWAIDRDVRLYGPDGFHPSELGSYLAALVVLQGLTGRPLEHQAPALVVAPGRAVSLDDRTAATLTRAARAVSGRGGG